MSSSRNLGEAPMGLKLLHSSSPSTCSTSSNLKQALRRMALFLAQSWKVDHPDPKREGDQEVDACILQVTVEMAKAAKAVGGVAGIAVLSGEGSEAAKFACHCVLSTSEDPVSVLENSI
jgi:hypothetical protein